MLGVAGILNQELTGKLPALAAMDFSLALATGRNGTLPVERVAVGLNTAAAVKGRFVFTSGAVQSAS